MDEELVSRRSVLDDRAVGEDRCHLNKIVQSELYIDGETEIVHKR